MKLSEGTEYNYAVVWKLAGQGLLYLRMKLAYNFVVCDLDDEFTVPCDTELETDTIFKPRSTVIDLTTQSSNSTCIQSAALRVSNTPSNNYQPIDTSHETGSDVVDETKNEKNFFTSLVEEFPLVDAEPTEMLRYLQKQIVKGRALDNADDHALLDG